MKVGDKVMLRGNSYYYNQAPGVVGEVTELDSPEGWAMVKWNQERTPGRPDEDNYPTDDLIPATKLDYLLLGLDMPDNAVHNEPEVNND